MNILFIVSRPLEINSSASLRNINTINGLSRLGHSVTVVSAEASKFHSAFSEVCLEEKVNHIRIKQNAQKEISSRMSKHPLLNKFRVLIYKQFSSASVYDSWKYIINDDIWNSLDYSKYDILISSSDPKSSHLVAEKIADSRHIPWIQIWGDPFTGDITSQGGKEKAKGKEEKRFLSKCKKAFFLSPFTCDDMKTKYQEYRDKLFFMPRPYIEPQIYKDTAFHAPIRFSYCGDYNSNVRNIMPLIKSVKSAGDKIHLSVVGNSNIELISSENIDVKGRVSQNKVAEIESQSDVLIHLCNLSGTQIPGKLYNYSATNKPILFILDGEKEKMRVFFSQYNRYLFCDNEEHSIENAIEEICEKHSLEKLAPIKDFQYDQVLGNLVNLK